MHSWFEGGSKSIYRDDDRSTKPTPSQHQANKVKLFKRNRSRGGSLQNAENELTQNTRKHQTPKA